MADTLKIVEAMLENAANEHEKQSQLLQTTTRIQPDAAALQNASNYVWGRVEQHRPILDGFDLTGQEQDIIEESYPRLLGTPKNDLIAQQIDQVRDISYWERAGKVSGKRQASELNKAIAQAMVTQGSLHFRSNATSGYDFIAEGQAILNERQGQNNGRYFLLNDRDQLKYSKDLASRENLVGRPDETWITGTVGEQVAGFDRVLTGSYLPNLAGGADPATTVTADQSFAPEGGSVDAATGVVTNVDYRSATIPVTASAGYNVGDKVTFANGGTAVQAVGLEDKTPTGQPMTFTIVAKPNATSITVYPKPIAADDPGLTDLEKAYANVDTRILNLATVNRVNIDASVKTNLFWDERAVEVMTGEVPAELFKQFGGMKVASAVMDNGQTMYMMYDGDIVKANFTMRIFTWYGITIANPQAVGVATSF